MKDVLKITMCVEMLIKEQMRKYRVKMEDISQLEAAESIAFRRLSLLRQNAPWPFKLGFSSPYEGVLTRSPKAAAGPGGPRRCARTRRRAATRDREKEMLIGAHPVHQEEKEDITYRLPELDPRGSDEENVDSEASASTESLLEERAAGEGPPAPAPPRPGAPAPRPRPAEAAAPPRRPPSFITVRVKTPRRTPVLPTANIKLPPGLAARRREPPARRPDLVRSVYAAPGALPPALGAPEPAGRAAAPPAALRRYSDPPMYCLPPDAGPADG
ncbi:unconventional myosin-IXb-like [Dipodomys spectabilis]|uniref:unconventional myosin-IXb-like n=1 Tax=Dipodomys spectabilis TaxID=105255 RepID=UPI001C5474D6|nr:unconventional myosin-IXb-like [Dipodomys spectabilis]